MPHQRILVVEDEPAIADTIVYALSSDGFDPHWCATGGAALDAARGGGFALAVLDVGLPDINGLELFKQLQREQGLPAIFLTARSTEIDRVVGLELGADDYIAKPFRLAELIARVRARLRVVEQATRATPMLEGAGLRVDRDARRTFMDDREVELTSKEFDLLALLMSRPGVTFTREQIMNQVWDEHWWGSTRTLDTHVSTLRKKIGDDSDPPSIVVTIRGVGFRFQG